MTCMLGGTVATNASGGRGFHYGPTRDWIRRVRVVLPNGDVIDVRRGEVQSKEGAFEIITSDGEAVEVPLPDYTAPPVKNAAGYYVAEGPTDLVDLFIGAEGTLGAFSLVEISLTDLPEEIFSCIAFFESLDDSVAFMREARRRSRSEDAIIDALMLDYIDHTSFNLVRADHPNIPDEAGGAIYFEQVLAGDDEPILAWAELIEEYRAIEDWSGFDPRERQMMKDMRHAIPETIHEIVRGRGLSKIATDLAVPADALDEMLASYRRVGESSGLDYCFFGHIGDNHLHFNFLPKTEEEYESGMQLALQLCRRAIDFGGTISAEHGCGKKAYVDNGRRVPLLELMYGEEGLRCCARTKLAVDPDGLVNRGNIIPARYLQ
jgi:D-lactate dehydrogenase (cytochrome)